MTTTVEQLARSVVDQFPVEFRHNADGADFYVCPACGGVQLMKAVSNRLPMVHAETCVVQAARAVLEGNR